MQLIRIRQRDKKIEICLHALQIDFSRHTHTAGDKIVTLAAEIALNIQLCLFIIGAVRQHTFYKQLLTPLFRIVYMLRIQPLEYLPARRRFLFSVEYGLNPKVVYPHSFRHRFAKNFLEKYNDISLLADLMEHESIETTRIYLRKTASEQQEIVDKVVTW